MKYNRHTSKLLYIFLAGLFIVIFAILFQKYEQKKHDYIKERKLLYKKEIATILEGFRSSAQMLYE